MFKGLLATKAEIMLTVRDRARIVYQGPVSAITSLNNRGRFDILPEHANFISLIKDFVILHKTDGTEQEMKLTRGVLKVEGKAASIYLGVSPDIKAGMKS